ncbi:MAG: hypothetical protein ABI665_14050 [Vicinamibacterales bacterium]
MPFLRLTRDRRGFENTFLLHADRPGERPRLLYWYRTAPGIVLGRPPLDEDAIRTIEEQHPEVDFDWPAILALGEAMIHEEEAATRPQKRGRPDQPRRSRDQQREPRPAEVEAVEELPLSEELLPDDEAEEITPIHALEAMAAEPRAQETQAVEEPEPPTTHGLLEELVGREIATRLRARHVEISARIHEKEAEPGTRASWLRRAEALNPDTWLTPEAILEGVRNADKLFEALRQELLGEG